VRVNRGIAAALILVALLCGCGKTQAPQEGKLEITVPSPEKWEEQITLDIAGSPSPGVAIETTDVDPSRIPVPAYPGATLKSASLSHLKTKAGLTHEHIVAAFISPDSMDKVDAYYREKMPDLNRIDTRGAGGKRRILLSSMLSMEGPKDLEDMKPRCNINITEAPGGGTAIAIQTDRFVEKK
jgi:hypothetical protein